MMDTGEYYHLYNRGNNRLPIFFSKENYHYFLHKLDHYLTGWVEFYTYALMPNHFHLFFHVTHSEQIINDKKLTISDRFKYMFMSYSKSINFRYDRSGALFQPKFKAKHVNSDAYFSWLVQYIHMNPVKAGLCEHPSQWKFSSYNSIISDLPTKIERKKVLEWFGNKERFEQIHSEHGCDLMKSKLINIPPWVSDLEFD